MANYNLQHGNATSSNGVACGTVIVSSSGGSTTVRGNPPGGGQPVDITDYTYTPKAGGGGTLLNPVPGDQLNLGSYSVTVSSSSYSFGTNATYRNANAGNNGGWYTQPGLTAGLNDWDAADGGSGEP